MPDWLLNPPTVADIWLLLRQESTQWQLAIIITGLLMALLTGQRVQRRLTPVIQPGVTHGLTRMAMRTGVLAMIPLIWWMWLLAGSSILKRWHQMPTEILHFAIMLVGALTLIRMGVFVLRHSFSPGSRLKAWESVLTITIWSIVALHILGLAGVVTEILDENAVIIGNTRISAYNVVSLLLSVAFLLLAALWIANLIHSRLMMSTTLDATMKIALSKTMKFTLSTLAVIVAMVASGIDLSALALFGGALGVGIGLGLQRIVSNFLSGFVLIFEESIRPGDTITVGTTYGVVKAMHARHVVIRTRDGVDILVPNESLLTTDITNWSYADRNVRVRLPVQISYYDDPEQAIAGLERVAKHPRVLLDPPAAACLTGFGDSGINLELRVWINDPEGGVGNVRSDLYRAIWREFKAIGITIPYPQRDIHIKSGSGSKPIRPNDAPDSLEESGHDQMHTDGEGPED